MIPSIFVSSTIADLQHLREALRGTVEELAYRPVFSEFGDVGYLPRTSAEQSCYLTMRDCQIAVLILGKRYGSVSANHRSITHNEFLAARENTIPVVCLVDREVLSYKKVFDATGECQAPPCFPGMDAPRETFRLVQEIMDSPVNNGILPFSSVADARTLLKTQLAHIFGDLLRSKFDPINASIKDVLSEVITLRQELRNKDMDPQPFVRAVRFLLNDANEQLRDFVDGISGSIEVAVPLMLKCKTFEDYLNATNSELTVDDSHMDLKALTDKNDLVVLHQFMSGRMRDPVPGEPEMAYWGILRGNRAIMNSSAQRLLVYTYEALRKAAGM